MTTKVNALTCDYIDFFLANVTVNHNVHTFTIIVHGYLFHSFLINVVNYNVHGFRGGEGRDFGGIQTTENGYFTTGFSRDIYWTLKSKFKKYMFPKNPAKMVKVSIPILRIKDYQN